MKYITVKIKKSLGDYTAEWAISLSILFLIALIIFSIKSDMDEKKRWELFSVEHECQIIGRKKATSSVGSGMVMGANGQMSVGLVTTTIPSQTGYKCNDGIEYWR